jgi:hypothetical protein
MPDREIPSPGELVRHAYRKVEAEREALFRIAAIPVALEFLISVLLRPQHLTDPLNLLAGIAILIPATLFDVAWLRRLLGADGTDPLLPYRWTRRQTGYLLRLAMLILLLLSPTWLLAMMVGPSSIGTLMLILLAGAIVYFFLFLRLSMFLIAQAVDQRCDLRQSWLATQQGAGRLFWGAAFVSLPVLIVAMVFVGVVDASGLARIFPLLTTLTLAVIQMIGRALFLAVIARVYEIRMTGGNREWA